MQNEKKLEYKEGVDAPVFVRIIVSRPQSPNLYKQMIGRGYRNKTIERITDNE